MKHGWFMAIHRINRKPSAALWLWIGFIILMAQPAAAMAATIAQIALSLREGFYEIPDTRIESVFPKSSQGEDGRGVMGPRSVIGAWNGAAFDDKNLDWYFHGGGHADYGGNEVYRFSFHDLTWKRLTDPAPYPKRKRDKSATVEARCPYPVSGPPSSHTYDGIIFLPSTNTILLKGDIAFCPSGYGMRWSNGAYEFNPSETETRNQIRPLEWRHRTDISAPKGYPHTAALPDGKILVGGNDQDAILDPVTARILSTNAERGNQGEGTSIYDAARNVVWLLNRSTLSRIDYRNGMISARQTITRSPFPGNLPLSAGIAIHAPTGRLVFWGGAAQVITFDPETGKWEIFDYKGQDIPGGHSIFSKWVYLPDFDVFAGYGDARRGILLYKLPAAGKGRALAAGIIPANPGR